MRVGLSTTSATVVPAVIAPTAGRVRGDVRGGPAGSFGDLLRAGIGTGEPLSQTNSAFLQHLAHEGEPVGMEAVRRQAEYHISLGDGRAIDELLPLSETDAEAGHVELPGIIQPGHLGHLAAHQGAARLAATLGHTRHHLGHLRRDQPAHGDIIEEEDGPGSDGEHIVDRHGHEIDTHGVKPARLLGEEDLGAHAVGAGDEDRFLQVRR